MGMNMGLYSRKLASNSFHYSMLPVPHKHTHTVSIEISDVPPSASLRALTSMGLLLFHLTSSS
jgi:hypothetical protein